MGWEEEEEEEGDGEGRGWWFCQRRSGGCEIGEVGMV
jgi:hypothetical protein